MVGAAELVPDGVWSEAGEDAEGDGEGGAPVLDMAFCLKASTVWSPENGGFTAKTMPFLQSSPTEE